MRSSFLLALLCALAARSPSSDLEALALGAAARRGDRQSYLSQPAGYRGPTGRPASRVRRLARPRRGGRARPACRAARPRGCPPCGPRPPAARAICALVRPAQQAQHVDLARGQPGRVGPGFFERPARDARHAEGLSRPRIRARAAGRPARRGAPARSADPPGPGFPRAPRPARTGTRPRPRPRPPPATGRPPAGRREGAVRSGAVIGLRSIGDRRSIGNRRSTRKHSSTAGGGLACDRQPVAEFRQITQVVQSFGFPVHGGHDVADGREIPAQPGRPRRAPRRPGRAVAAHRPARPAPRPTQQARQRRARRGGRGSGPARSAPRIWSVRARPRPSRPLGRLVPVSPG